MKMRNVQGYGNTIVEIPDLRAEVLAGARMLDTEDPQWAEVIYAKDGELEMADPGRCVLGHLWRTNHLGEYHTALRDLGFTESDSEEHGFNVSGEVAYWYEELDEEEPSDAQGYEDLAELWRDQVALRIPNSVRLPYADWTGVVPTPSFPVIRA